VHSIEYFLYFVPDASMKKKNGKSAAVKKRVPISNNATVIKDSDKREFVDLDDEDIGFGGWLKTGEGIEWMKLFVIGNSLIVFLTMTWPQLQKSFGIVKEMIYGEDDLY